MHVIIKEVHDNQLVQLQGEVGIGKTTVVVAAGHYMMERRMDIFSDGVILVELAGVHTFREFLNKLRDALCIGMLFS